MGIMMVMIMVKVMIGKVVMQIMVMMVAYRQVFSDKMPTMVAICC